MEEVTRDLKKQIWTYDFHFDYASPFTKPLISRGARMRATCFIAVALGLMRHQTGAAPSRFGVAKIG